MRLIDFSFDTLPERVIDCDMERLADWLALCDLL